MKLTAFLLIGATAVSAFAPSPAHLGRPSTWDIVEELDASDNSAASVGVAEVETPAEYQEKVEALAALLKEQQEKIASIKSLAEDLKGIKLSKPEGGSSSVDSAQMSKALEEAKSATEKFGMDSNEAKLAWETVEEIASSDVGEALKGSLEEECLVETIDACEAIEALQAALSKNEAKP
eukprot:CAMPEP_0178729292 /NCGR_PEP_ID=MMETSP0699-20121125/28887_1 /TAXON_ID=265572 /ORGANISM="Extubocellulus spinifer, Strain CCMP396" /LENGTH=178 /DNA_ID=CAMNT_0020381199 /DNA_START=21 /DNA_END=557 /DNA_ORIENTATION=-